jgi:tetratricopeptide (TPR) repeat protein
MLKGRVNGRKLADDLLIIQNHLLNQELEKQYPPLTLFEPVAANYRELKIKPQISEEERKYIVQANSFNEEKNYSRAIELYIKAIEIDQTAFPAAYLNLALLSAQMKEYYPAVYYMKKYLLLIPDAPDARAAQDNIYIWEGKMGK